MDWKSIKAVLCDISGVLYDPDGLGGGVPIDGSIEAVRRLKEAKFPLKFVTNESQMTRANLTAKLQRLGFQIDESDIVSPVTAARGLLKQRGWRAHLLVHQDCIPELQDVAADPADSSIDCVVIGDAAEGFQYAALNAAFQRLMRSQRPRLISLGMGRYYKQSGGLHMDVGAFTRAMEFAAGLTAEVVGKPDAGFFAAAIGQLEEAAAGQQPLPVGQVAMVGDDIVSDVGGAQAAGLVGVQVRTGKFRPTSDEPHPTVKPAAYVDNLKQMVDHLLG